MSQPSDPPILVNSGGGGGIRATSAHPGFPWFGNCTRPGRCTMHASHNLGGKDYPAFVGRYNRSSPPCSALWGTGRGAIWWWCKRSVCPPCLGPIAVCNRTRHPAGRAELEDEEARRNGPGTVVWAG